MPGIKSLLHKLTGLVAVGGGGGGSGCLEEKVARGAAVMLGMLDDNSSDPNDGGEEVTMVNPMQAALIRAVTVQKMKEIKEKNK